MYTTLSPPEIISALVKEQNTRAAFDAGMSIFPGGVSDSSIRAAALTAYNSGGGIVKLPPGNITLLSPLPLYNGVSYQGTGWQADAISSNLTASLGGTALIGDGTFDAFDYNNTDLGSLPPGTSGNNHAFFALMLNGVNISDMTLVNFNYGIKIGALYAPGCASCTFKRISFINCKSWCFWVENYFNIVCEQLICSNYGANGVGSTGIGAGGIAKVCSATASIAAGGNSLWTHILCTNANPLIHNIVQWGRASSFLNDENCFDEQTELNTSTTPVTQACTMTNLSANITVTDGTKFAVNEPVQFSTTANGFTQGDTYFIASISTNTITVTTTMGFGTAVTATGNSAVNILALGFPCFEFAGLDSGSGVTGSANYGIDAEGACTIRFLFQGNVHSVYECGTTTVTQTGNDYVTFWFTNVSNQNKLYCGNLFTIGSDGTGTYWLSNLISGSRYTYTSLHTSKNYTGQGIMLSVTNETKGYQGSAGLFLKGNVGPDAYINASTNGLALPNALTIDPVYKSTTATLSAGAGGIQINQTTGSASAFTMPTLAANLVGLTFEIVNPQPYVLTLTGASSQTFNNITSNTAYVLPPNSAARFIGMQAANGSGNFYWAVVGLSDVVGAVTIAQLLAVTPTAPGARMYVVDTVASAAQAYLTVIAGSGSNSVAGWATYTGSNWVWM